MKLYKLNGKLLKFNGKILGKPSTLPPTNLGIGEAVVGSTFMIG